MNITNYLLGLILIILLEQFHPAFLESATALLVPSIVLFGIYLLLTKFPTWWREHKREKAEEQKYEDAFMHYQEQHRAIRLKYDAEQIWNEATSVPKEYLEEIRSLNFKNRDMLIKRNGWTQSDFDDDGY
jgi:hypothetical protein